MLALYGCIGAAASGDIVISSDKTFSNKFNPYDNLTVKNGATLTLADRSGEPVGMEISKSLTVEKGGKITGNGLIIIHREAKVEGMPLYYRYNGVVYKVPEGMQLSHLGAEDDGYKPEFVYDKKEDKFILKGDFHGGDPFELYISDRFLTIIRKKTHQLSLSGITTGVKWSSSDKSVAKVSKTGLVTAVNFGSAVITGKYNNHEYSCEVEVVKKGLNFSELVISEGSEFFLSLNGYQLKSVKSSDKSVATINKKLTVKAVAPGECTITVKSKSGKKFKCKVRVEDPSQQNQGWDPPVNNPEGNPPANNPGGDAPVNNPGGDAPQD